MISIRCVGRWIRSLSIWSLDGLRLVLYTLTLAPAFVQFAWYYWVASSRTVVRYQTDSRRQYLDVYRPSPCSASSSLKNANAPLTSPVVFFCCGGAWIIGYKMWGALTARILCAVGVTVVVPDYRNYPWGTVPQMVDDVETALQWTLDHIATTGVILEDAAESKSVLGNAAEKNIEETGNATSVSRASTGAESTALPPLIVPPGNERKNTKRKVIVVGQSAGGHLIMTMILRKAVKQFKLRQTVTSTADFEDQVNNNQEGFVPADLSGMIALSAPFRLRAMETVFLKHGLDEHMVDRIFGGQRDNYDPFRILEQEETIPRTILSDDRVEAERSYSSCRRDYFQPSPAPLSLAEFLPPMRIYHGSCDQTVPEQGSIDFVELLQSHGIPVSYQSYNGWSHTDPILEGPMDADHRFHRDIVDAIFEWTSHDNDGDNDRTPEWPREGTQAAHVVNRRLCPRILIHLGRFFMPF